jgi:hypothetical protein
MLGYAGCPNNLDSLPWWMIARFLLGEAAPSINLVLMSFGGVLLSTAASARAEVSGS